MMEASGYDGGSFIPEFYDHVVPYAKRADMRFYVETAREFGGPVLELGCGTGRILLPTARAGIEIAGLDGSDGMLEECHFDRLPYGAHYPGELVFVARLA